MLPAAAPRGDYLCFMPGLRQLFSLVGHRGAVYTLAPAYEEHTFYSCGSDGALFRWQPNVRPLPVLVCNFSVQIFSLHYDAPSGFLVAGAMDGRVFVVEAASGRLVRTLADHDQSVFRILRHGNRLCVVSRDGTVSLWDAERDFAACGRWSLSAQGLRCMAFHERHPCAVGGAEGIIYLVDPVSGLQVGALSGPASSVFCLAYDREGCRLFAGSRDARLYVYDMPAGTLGNSINAHRFTINDLKLICDDQLLVTASRDKNIRIWDAASLQLLRSITAEKDDGHTHSVNTLLWMTAAGWLVSAGDDRIIRIWKFELP